MDQKVEKILRELESPHLDEAPFWNVPPATGVFLNSLVGLVKAQKVLEIGTSNGYSGICLAEALSHTDGVLYTVESHQKRFAMAKENFAKSGLEKFIRQVPGHAPEILYEKEREWDWLWDLVFIDATKMEYQSYAEFLVGRVRSGGLIIADNAVSHGREMKGYLDFVNSHPDLRTVVLPFDKGVALSVKG